MHVNVNIGQNRHFALHEALLIYRAGDEHNSQAGNTYVTHHPVITNKGRTPELGPARLLTIEFIQSLLQSLGTQLPAEFLPEQVIGRTDRLLAWWTPRQIRPMFFGNVQGNLKGISGRNFPQPALVWLAVDGALRIRALKDNQRPSPESPLAVAPYWNLYESGEVCLGTMRAPKVSTVASIAQWEESFYQSEFTHGNVGRVTRHPGGFEGLWKELADKKKFPAASLIDIPETVDGFLTGKRRGNGP
ncbi:PRTRC system protein B [Edaphobacter dinghuensis]|uniref:PRTRC genetic system protein B n=1 Tax=Edaphobacter dinghuensis TaxID=1560005 RepID=A0A917M907_9BACT|nr:PRTRC system protein B [Edaphobacter dinghuensis]GGG86907.1 hypothetical protein GCM10011585_33620 [Edaphobacter dinghuensis]